MRHISELLTEIQFTASNNLNGLRVSCVSTDSRNMSSAGLFVALSGLTVNGHNYIKNAVEKGCAAVVVDQHEFYENSCPTDTVFIKVQDSRIALGEIAAAFYDYPGKEVKLLGITGTNGKTTTTYLLESIVHAAGGNPGVIGTISYRYNGSEVPARFTTPEPVELQSILRQMVDGGVTHVIMEVSSHALVQKRLYGLKFDVAIFTNLTRDHLDFHGDMDQYFQAKKTLFLDYMKSDGTAVIMRDRGNKSSGKNDWGDNLYSEITALKKKGLWADKQILSCGRDQGNDIVVEKVKYAVNETTFNLNMNGSVQRDISLKLVGGFNLDNSLSAAGAARALGIKPKEICKGISQLQNVPGRLEKINIACPKHNQTSGSQLQKIPDVYVDFAHTPDALESVLKSLREITQKRLIVVFGCGGERDKGKRFLMGESAGKFADLVIITSDNSRSEPTEEIMAEIIRGVKESGKKGVLLGQGQGQGLVGYDAQPERSHAIQKAIMECLSGDIVVICGKGHETTQTTQDGTVFFDDRQESLKYIEQYSVSGEVNKLQQPN